MTEERIEGRLQLHIACIALAAVGKKDGALKDAKDALIREVVRIAHDASNPHLAGKPPAPPIGEPTGHRP